MQLPFFLITSLAVSSVLACPQHSARRRALSKRQEAATNETTPPPSEEEEADPPQDWSYDFSYDWGAIKPEYATCQTGTNQSPIALARSDGNSPLRPTFANYDREVTGEWTNWGYGPQFNLDVPNDDYTALPATTIGDTTIYLATWHTHAPSEHTVDGDPARAEMHLVHVDETGTEAGVIALLITNGDTAWPFLEQLPPYVNFTYGPSPRPVIDSSTGQPVVAEAQQG
ncbi:MAG: hypothetical protein Q9183_004022, partial [Haloplaca sp. 2 TL-2023]